MIIATLAAYNSHLLEAMYLSINAAYWVITNAYLSETTSHPHKMRGDYWGKCKKMSDNKLNDEDRSGRRPNRKYGTTSVAGIPDRRCEYGHAECGDRRTGCGLAIHG